MRAIGGLRRDNRRRGPGRMIDPQLYVAFVLATGVLMLIPGPNVALIVANSVAYGTRYGLLTVAGTSSAMVVQLALTALGMAALLGTRSASTRLNSSH